MLITGGKNWYGHVQCLSIYMITRCAFVRTYVRTFIAGCPEARRGVPVDLNATKRGHIVVVLSYHNVEAEQQLKATIARTTRSRRTWLGSGDG